MYEPLTVVGVIIFVIGALINPSEKAFLFGAREVIRTTLIGCGAGLLGWCIAHFAYLAIG